MNIIEIALNKDLTIILNMPLSIIDCNNLLENKGSELFTPKDLLTAMQLSFILKPQTGCNSALCSLDKEVTRSSAPQILHPSHRMNLLSKIWQEKLCIPISQYPEGLFSIYFFFSFIGL